MPRSEARLQFTIWDGLKGLSDAGKLLYNVLLTEEYVTQCGRGPILRDVWADRLEWDRSTLDKALVELDEQRFVLVDAATNEVLVRTFIRGDKVDRQPRVLQAALKSALQVKSPRLREALAVELRRLDDGTRTGLLADVVQEALTVADQLDGRKARRLASVPAKPAPKADPDPAPEPAAAGRPSERCPLHQAKRTTKACRACRAARLKVEAWDAERRRAVDDENAAGARERAAARRAAIDACNRCDAEGYEGDGRTVCAHKPQRPVIKRRAP